MGSKNEASDVYTMYSFLTDSHTYDMRNRVNLEI